MKKLVVTTVAIAALSSSLMAGVPAQCFGCHGKNGEKNTVAHDKVPNKLSKAEIETALKEYKSGKRANPMMKNFTKNLTDAQIKDIANAWGK